MEPTLFLKERLGTLAVQFPGIQIKYAYKPSIATHIVELSPVKDYYENDLLEAAWVPLSIEFMETFIAENICFVSSDSRLAIPHSEMEWNIAAPVWDNTTINNLFEVMLHSSFSFEFPNTFVREETINTHISVDTMHTQYQPFADIIFKTASQGHSESQQFFQFIYAPNKSEAESNTQYAMAA